ncbi:MAG: histidine--tRNA ligase, partial [Clostridia bacterium]|nr:histidine--tRNA ligase [Clostridia bacterium]
SINSIGCPVCRKRYHEALREYFGAYKGELCPLCLDRMERNPLRLLDCKEQHCGEIAANAPVTLDYLCDECHTHFEALKRELDLLGITYKIDPRIVRGLDYYTKTVFEFVATNIGAQSTVCGGGRYDRLVEQLGGPALPGLGFGCGLERLLMVLAESGIALPSAPTPDIFVAAMGSSAAEKTAQLVTALRRAGFAAERDVTGRSLKAQMKYADKLGANFSLTIGDNELAENTATLKNMRTGEASPVALTAEAIGAVLSAR